MADQSDLPTERQTPRRKLENGLEVSEYEAWYAAPEGDDEEDDETELADLAMKAEPVPNDYQGFYDLPDEDED